MREFAGLNTWLRCEACPGPRSGDGPLADDPVLKAVWEMLDRIECGNCGGDGFSLEGGDCPACKGTGWETE